MKEAKENGPVFGGAVSYVSAGGSPAARLSSRRSRLETIHRIVSPPIGVAAHPLSGSV
jgi:hypothetical protein